MDPEELAEFGRGLSRGELPSAGALDAIVTELVGTEPAMGSLLSHNAQVSSEETSGTDEADVETPLTAAAAPAGVSEHAHLIAPPVNIRPSFGSPLPSSSARSGTHSAVPASPPRSPVSAAAAPAAGAPEAEVERIVYSAPPIPSGSDSIMYGSRPAPAAMVADLMDLLTALRVPGPGGGVIVNMIDHGLWRMFDPAEVVNMGERELVLSSVRARVVLSVPAQLQAAYLGSLYRVRRTNRTVSAAFSLMLYLCKIRQAGGVAGSSAHQRSMRILEENELLPLFNAVSTLCMHSYAQEIPAALVAGHHVNVDYQNRVLEEVSAAFDPAETLITIMDGLMGFDDFFIPIPEFMRFDDLTCRAIEALAQHGNGTQLMPAVSLRQLDQHRSSSLLASPVVVPAAMPAPADQPLSTSSRPQLMTLGERRQAAHVSTRVPLSSAAGRPGQTTTPVVMSSVHSALGLPSSAAAPVAPASPTDASSTFGPRLLLVEQELAIMREMLSVFMSRLDAAELRAAVNVNQALLTAPVPPAGAHRIPAATPMVGAVSRSAVDHAIALLRGGVTAANLPAVREAIVAATANTPSAPMGSLPDASYLNAATANRIIARLRTL